MPCSSSEAASWRLEKPGLREAATAAQLADPAVHSSSKLRELAPLATEIASEGHKMLIFSEWERMTRHALDVLQGAGVKAVRLHGGMGLRPPVRTLSLILPASLTQEPP